MHTKHTHTHTHFTDVIKTHTHTRTVRRLAPKGLISYCFQHKPLYDSRERFIPRQVYGACFKLGRIPPGTIHKPKQAIQLMEREEYSYCKQITHSHTQHTFF